MYESNLLLETKMVIHGSTSQQAALGHIKNALGQVMRSEEESSIRIQSWEAIYKYMMEQEVHLSPVMWLEILEDKDIGPTIENKDARYEALVKSMPHMNGHPMRVDQNTFQPSLYIDGVWVLVTAVNDSFPGLAELQEQAAEIKQQTEASEKQFVAAEAVMAKVKVDLAVAEEVMAKVADLNYNDAMSVVDDSK